MRKRHGIVLKATGKRRESNDDDGTPMENCDKAGKNKKKAIKISQVNKRKKHSSSSTRHQAFIIGDVVIKEQHHHHGKKASSGKK